MMEKRYMKVFLRNHQLGGEGKLSRRPAISEDVGFLRNLLKKYFYEIISLVRAERFQRTSYFSGCKIFTKSVVKSISTKSSAWFGRKNSVEPAISFDVRFLRNLSLKVFL